MKTILTHSLFIILLFITYTGCNKDTLNPKSVVEEGQKHYNETALGTLDKWIADNITKPYNIEVNYRWDKNVAQKNNFTYPPKQENVQAVLETFKALFINFYNSTQIGGQNFMKGKNPIKIYMYGGPNIDGNGVQLIFNHKSASEEMYIYDVNAFNAKDYNKVYDLMRSIHHQFALRLMDIYDYNKDKFIEFSKAKYTGGTTLISVVDKKNRITEYSPYPAKRGFLTFYGFISPESDLADMISAKLTFSPKEIITALLDAKTPDDAFGDKELQDIYNKEAAYAYNALKSKLDYIDNYFTTNLKIDLNAAQIISVRMIKDYVNKDN